MFLHKSWQMEAETEKLKWNLKPSKRSLFLSKAYALIQKWRKVYMRCRRCLLARAKFYNLNFMILKKKKHPCKRLGNPSSFVVYAIVMWPCRRIFFDGNSFDFMKFKNIHWNHLSSLLNIVQLHDSKYRRIQKLYTSMDDEMAYRMAEGLFSLPENFLSVQEDFFACAPM